MGHSRGGEGVVWQVIVDRERPDPYGIDAVLPLAPVDFTRATVNDVPLAVMLPYCDGDVFDLQGVHFFDDARYLVAGDPLAEARDHGVRRQPQLLQHGLDPVLRLPGRLRRRRSDAAKAGSRPVAAASRRAAAYIVTYFRRYLGEDTSVDPVWTGEPSPRTGSPRRGPLVSYLAPDTWRSRLDVDRFTDRIARSPATISAGARDPDGRLDLRLVRGHVREPVHHRPRLVRRHPSARALPRGAGVVGRTGLRAVPTPRGHARRPAVRRAAVPARRSTPTTT